MRTLLVALVALLPLQASAFAETRKPAPCQVEGVSEEVRCGTFDVYENRVANAGRKIPLKIVILPATGPHRLTDPLVFLAGGGVAPATFYAGFLSRAFPELRHERDILLVDQRGTGGSNALQCDFSTDPTNPEYRDDARFRASVRRCRAEVEKHADLRQYTTANAMDDLEDVRKWLGYSKLNLYGASYGTAAAMVFLRQHPNSVRTMTIQGVIPLDMPMWLEAPRNAQRALDLVFAACAHDHVCHTAFPDVSNEFNALLKRLHDQPVHAAATLDDEVLRDVVSRMLYGAERVHDLPLLIHLAYTGDYAALEERAANRDEGGFIPRGVYLSLVCSELVPQFDRAAVPNAAAGTFAGSFRIEREIVACDEWIHHPLPPQYWTLVKSNASVLAMNGELDHLTPPSYGAHVVTALPNGKHLVLPNRGHNDVDECVTSIIASFVSRGDAKKLDASCLEKSPPLSFAVTRKELQH